MEIGPYRVKEDGTLRLNDGSWNEFANLLFVDNPVGTGFSYVDTDSYLHELGEMADNFVTFLEKFFDLFPHFEQDDVGYTPRNLKNLTNLSRSTLRVNPMLGSIFLILRARSSTEIKRQPRHGIWQAC
jgi:Serine carboxypeptidase